MNNITMTTLEPTNGRKSFYGKAHILIDGNKKYLISYTSVCCMIDEDGNVHRYHHRQSGTTTSHLKAFLGCLYQAYKDMEPTDAPHLGFSLEA